MQKNNLVEALIGLVVLLAAGAFTSYVYSNTDAGSAAGHEYRASFTAIDGLSMGADVRIGGVKVGSVVSQELDAGTYRAQVRFTVDKLVPLADDSEVRIASEGLLGGSYLRVIPGGSLDSLAPGDEFEQTQSAVDVIDLVKRAVLAAGGDDE